MKNLILIILLKIRWGKLPISIQFCIFFSFINVKNPIACHFEFEGTRSGDVNGIKLEGFQSRSDNFPIFMYLRWVACFWCWGIHLYV